MSLDPRNGCNDFRALLELSSQSGFLLAEEYAVAKRSRVVAFRQRWMAKNLITLSQWTAATSLVALLILCLLWELLLAPLRPGGSLLALKAAPLALPLAGIYAGRRYTYQWSSLLVLAYFTEGVVRAWSESGTSQVLAAAETALSVVCFASLVSYARLTRTAA